MKSTKKTLLFASLFAAVLLGVAAWDHGLIAQSINIPQAPTVNPTADRLQVVPLGIPSAQSVYASPAELRATSLTVKTTPTSAPGAGTGAYAIGYVSYFTNYQTDLVLSGASTMTYAYVVFAPAPSDGAQECIFSKPAVTTLTFVVVNGSGQAINNAATSLSANSKTCFIYSASNLTWDRSQ